MMKSKTVLVASGALIFSLGAVQNSAWGALSGGATAGQSVAISAKSNPADKSFTLSFKTADQKNCLYVPLSLHIESPLLNAAGVPPVGAIKLATALGPCRRLPGESHGSITLLQGADLPKVADGFYEVSVDGRGEKQLLYLSPGKVTWVDQGE